MKRLAGVADLVPVAAIHRRTSISLPVARAVRVGPLHSKTDWKEALIGIDTVVHLAARVHVMRERHGNPLEEFRSVNRYATVALARACISHDVRRLVFVSSVKAAADRSLPGRPLEPLDELCPVDPYGISKAEAESELRDVAASSALELVIIRPTVVIGRGAVGNIQSLVRAVRLGIPLPFGSVNNRRSVVSLDNLTSLLALSVRHPSANGGIHYAADPQAFSTAELIGMVARALGRRDPTISCPPWAIRKALRLVGGAKLQHRLSDSLEVNVSSARLELGWEPEVATLEGIRRAIG